jgi:hypothetical protein
MRWKVATKLLGKAENASINSRAAFVGFVNQVVAKELNLRGQRAPMQIEKYNNTEHSSQSKLPLAAQESQNVLKKLLPPWGSNF